MVINMSIGNGLKFKMIPTIKNLFMTPAGDIHYIGGSEILPPPLSSVEEAKILNKLGTEEDGSAKAVLIEHNLRLVVYIAKKFENTGVGVEDLISIGTIGLIKAINTYNKEKNIKLATYASRCIENEILMYLRRNNKTKMEVSIDEPLNVDWDGNELLLSDILGTDEDVVYKNIEDEAEIKMLNKAIDKLSKREKMIVELRYGLNREGGLEMTQKDAADYLVNRNVPFRDAHGIIGRLVLYCIEKNTSIDALSLEELKAISPVFEADIYEAVSLKTCVDKRLTIGAPGEEAMKEVIRINKGFLSHFWTKESVKF